MGSKKKKQRRKRLSFVLHYLLFHVFIKIELLCVLLDDSGILYFLLSAKVNEYDQQIPKSQTAVKPVVT